MDYDDIFAIYYTLYQSDADIPGSDDDEYKLGMPLANAAIRRWANYDSTYWNELFTNAQSADDGDLIVTTETSYDAPSDMLEAGGFVRFLDPVTGVIQSVIQIVEPNQAQFLDLSSSYCYFTGDPNNGFVLQLNPAPLATLQGCLIDYIYYKQPTMMTGGNSAPEMHDPMYIVHSMLANRFRGSRNPYYSSAQTDAEDALRSMQAFNNAGTWANPWTLQDNSPDQWGAQSRGGFFGSN